MLETSFKINKDKQGPLLAVVSQCQPFYLEVTGMGIKVFVTIIV